MNWNLKDIYKTENDFYKEKDKLQEKLTKITEFKGKLNESSKNIYNCYKLYEEILEIYEKLYSYGMLNFHLDMADTNRIKLYKIAQSIGTEVDKATSFIVPEITRIDNEKLLAFINEDSNLDRYKRELEDIIKSKEHILTEREEELLASYQEIFSSMKNTFDILTNTELKFGNIIDSEGTEIELTNSNYSVFIKDKNENLRKQAFELMHKKYSEFLNTIGELYITRVKLATITSKLRKYKSSLDMAVDKDDATIKVYDALIEAVNKNINVNHKFMKIKKDLLKKEELHLYDIHVNSLETKNEDIPFEKASKQVIDALSIMGEEYTFKLKEAFENNWLDVYEKKNKRSGGYNMGVYGVHPFILLNYKNKKEDVSTIAHELGHSMHSYYSNANQNILDANYTIMVAEIASTTNEILLAMHQIKNEKDENKKKEYAYQLIDTFRATFFVQAMFAEFEKTVHSKIEQGEMLTSKDLNEIYYNLNKKYYGENVVVDEQIKSGWAIIPHFYRPFYVYKYATGISAAIIIAKNIFEHKEGYVEKYIEMLKQGCTKKSVELLKMVDVDLEDYKTYENAIKWMEEITKLLW